MRKLSPRSSKVIKVAVVYLAIVAGVFGFSVVRARLLAKAAAPAPQPTFSDKPFFSLTTNGFLAGEWPIVSEHGNVDYLTSCLLGQRSALLFGSRESLAANESADGALPAFR